MRLKYGNLLKVSLEGLVFYPYFNVSSPTEFYGDKHITCIPH
jgi:hypothetical protein